MSKYVCTLLNFVCKFAKVFASDKLQRCVFSILQRCVFAKVYVEYTEN